MERHFLIKPKLNAQERGLTRARAGRTIHPSAIEQSSFVRVTLLMVAILVQAFLPLGVRAVHPYGGTRCGWMYEVLSNTPHLIGGRIGVDNTNKTSTTRAQDLLRDLPRGGTRALADIKDSVERDCSTRRGGGAMAIVHDSPRRRATLRARLATEGVGFGILPETCTAAEADSFQAWPLITSRNPDDVIDVSTSLWLSLQIGDAPMLLVRTTTCLSALDTPGAHRSPRQSLLCRRRILEPPCTAAGTPGSGVPRHHLAGSSVPTSIHRREVGHDLVYVECWRLLGGGRAKSGR